MPFIKKVTDSDIDFMMKSNLSNGRVAKILGLSYPTISKYRNENGYIRKAKTGMSDDDIKAIIESKLSGTSLSKEMGYSQSTISNVRTKYGYKLEHRGTIRNGKRRSEAIPKKPVIEKPEMNSFFNMKLI